MAPRSRPRGSLLTTPRPGSEKGNAMTQEPDPPDLRLMVLAVLMLLGDIEVEIEATATLERATLLRLAALRRAVERFKDAEL